jgi:hypothetical protein
MRYTLIEMVQRILAAMDSDEVNSITDTAESVQVALLIEGCFYDLIAEANLPPVGTFFELTASGDNEKPTLMTVPKEVMSCEWVKYDKQESGDTYEDWTELKFMPIEKFMSRINAYRSREASTVGAMDQVISTGEGSYTATFMYRNDKQPDVYTTFDDETLIFDSYDSTLDTTLQATKTQCWGSVIPVFTQTDAFQPDLNAIQESLLMNMAKVRAFEELKQTQYRDGLDHARRNRLRLRSTKKKTPFETPHPLAGLPNYGRK